MPHWCDKHSEPRRAHQRRRRRGRVRQRQRPPFFCASACSGAVRLTAKPRAALLQRTPRRSTGRDRHRRSPQAAHRAAPRPAIPRADLGQRRGLRLPAPARRADALTRAVVTPVRRPRAAGHQYRPRQRAQRFWVTIDDSLHRAGDKLTCIYATDAAPVGRTVEVEARSGKAVRITVPAAGFVVYERRLHQTRRVAG